MPDASDRFDEHAHERRHLGAVTDATGMVIVDGQLDPAGGSTFVATLDHLAEQDRHALREDGDPDLRTRGQRRADALVRMAELAAQQLQSPTTPDGIRVGVPRVVVHVDADQQAATTSTGQKVGPGTLARMVCDAVLERVTLSCGRVVSMTSLGRLATPGQRAALTARDKGCSWPGCTHHRRCARPTTSSGGPEAAPPPSTTWRCCAPATTPRSTPNPTTHPTSRTGRGRC